MAGLIPQSFIDNLLNRTDIVDVVDKRVPLKKQGNNYTACCPFHQEKTPSFSVNQERQFYYCFGCGAGGNAIGFVMNFDKSDFPVAVETLAKDAGLEVPREESQRQIKQNRQHTSLYDVLSSTSAFYQIQLRKHPQKEAAVQYLKSRGLTGNVAASFAIGFAPPGWDNLLKEFGPSAESQNLLLGAGLTIERSKDKPSNKMQNRINEYDYYDRFRNRIIFPIRDSRGRTIAFGGRVLGEEKPKYLNSPETAVFQKSSELYGLYELKKSGEKFSKIILVEGYMDVIALSQMGIKNSVATLGTATNSRHLGKIFKQVPELIFCFDGDDAGEKAAWRALETALPHMQDGRQVKFLFLPNGEDPDTYVRTIGKRQFLIEVSSAKPLEDFLFEHLSADLDTTTGEGKARLSNLAKSHLSKIPDGIYSRLMLEKLAGLVGLPAESIAKLYSKSASSHPNDNIASDGIFSSTSVAGDFLKVGSQSKREDSFYQKPASIKAIELLLQKPEIALSLTKDLNVLHSAEDEGRKLLISLIEMIQKDPKTDIFTMLGYCYGSNLGNQFTQIFSDEKITPKEGLQGEFIQIIDNILSDMRRKLDLVKLKTELRAKVIEEK
uniref:DNA primase n=1 Tax=uncultured bacterium HF130_01F24 TaxID=710814 RepID=E0XPI6_9BACT|nr:DNA primase (bacterial type) [uncultured bacterium HF130_01F24]